MPDDHLFLATRNHLLVTAGLTVAGTVFPCAGRLSDRLRGPDVEELLVQDAEIRRLDGGGETVARLRLPVSAILLAHEFIDLGSDSHLRGVAAPEERVFVRICFGSDAAFSVAGWTRRDRLETPKDAWLIVTSPRLTAARSGAPAAGSQLERLPYLIVHRRRLAAIIEDNEEGKR